MRCLAATGLLLGILLVGAGRADAGDEADAWQWSRSLRSLNLAGEKSPGDLLPAYRLSGTRLRLESTWQSTAGWRLETAADWQLLGTDPPGNASLPGDGVNRRFDLDRSWQHDHRWASRLQADRFHLTWTSEHLDASIGRQAIGFGRIATYSPLDIIAPFPVEGIDTDVRPGIDAARVTLHYGLDGQLGAVAVLGDNSRHDSYLLTWADNRNGIDLLAVGGVLRHRPMIGAGLAGSIGSLGLKGEATFFEGARFGKPGGDLHQHMLVAALESWYRFDNGLTLIVEYLHNGTGARKPAAYPQAALAGPAREGLASLLGRHYLLAAPSYELHPLVTLNGLLIWNLNDGSHLLRPSLAISLADNLGLELFWTHPSGEPPQPRSFPFPPETRGEFGGRGDSGGFFLTWFF